MATPFDFASDPTLAGIGNLMQRAANRRADWGLISADGQTHRTAKQMALYDAGYSLLSKAYADAGK